jgi:hypothetical protein
MEVKYNSEVKKYYEQISCLESQTNDLQQALATEKLKADHQISLDETRVSEIDRDSCSPAASHTEKVSSANHENELRIAQYIYSDNKDSYWLFIC